MVSFDNCYLMDVGKSAVIWKGFYKIDPIPIGDKVDFHKDYLHIETMGWYLNDRYRTIMEDINSRLRKLREERK